MAGTIKEQTKKMLEVGIIEPSKSPYSSPVVLVKKPIRLYGFVLSLGT